MPTPSPERGDRRSLRTRCVLWHAPGAVVPPNLGASLTARPVDVIACDNPYAALAALCASAPGASYPACPTLLVLIEPANLPLATRVLILAEQVVPHAARWAYESGAEVKLRAVTASIVANLQRPGAVPPMPLPTIVTTRVAGSPAAPNPAGKSNGTHAEMGKPIPVIRDHQAQKQPVSVLKVDASLSLGLTAEELAMLLADAPENTGATAPVRRSPPASSPPPPGAHR